MSRLNELKVKAQQIDVDLAEVYRAIETIPDSLPWSEFCRRLNNLETRGIELEEQRKRIQREIELYEDILEEVRNAVAS